MAVTWSWKNKIGKIKITDDHERTFWVNMYDGGNCPLVLIYEWKENRKNMYTLWNFFGDKAHMQKCFGLQKNVEGKKVNIFKDYKFNMEIKREAEHFDLITRCFLQCPNITIKVKEMKKRESNKRMDN